jgi:hypothetical protein
VKGDEVPAELGQGAEQFQAGRGRQAREINLQKLPIAAPVFGAIGIVSFSEMNSSNSFLPEKSFRTRKK